MDSLDTRLLSVFSAIHQTGSVSRAAQLLGLPQPAVSLALNKLRRRYGDPLFVRTSSGMEATALAKGLVEPVRQVLEGLEQVLSFRDGFDAASSQRSFRILMADISQLVLLPRLLSTLRQHAPGVRIEVLPLSEDTAERMASGEADLAIGYLPQLGAGFYQQLLFGQRFVCMTGVNHPRIKKSLSLAQFEAEKHASVMVAGPAPWILDREIARQGIQRQVVLQLPNYLGAGFVAESTDLIVTIPVKLAELLRGRGEFRLFDVPFPLPDYEVRQHWHQRFHSDRGNQWLRALISGLLQEKQSGRKPAAR